MKRALSAIVLAGALVSASRASAQPTGTEGCKSQVEASERFAAGKALYKEGDYKLALIEFERAYDLCPNWRSLFNIGQVNMQLNNYAKARVALERYVKEGGADIPDDRRAQVETDLAALRQRTANLMVTTNVPGATIFLDDVEVGKTPLAAALLIDAGKHNVVAKLNGRDPGSKSITLAGADNVTVALELHETKIAPVVIAPPVRQDETPRASSTGPVIAWTATGVLAIGAGVTGFLSLNDRGKLDDLKKTASTPEERESVASRAKNLALVSDILTGTAVVSGIVALYLTLKPSAPTKKEAARIDGGFGLGSVYLTGKF